ncbi:MAG TPA: MarR family transcriptional regulator [Burkholderiales bacterium]|nr:MarR family transcriptional regulator [Burkholderiales bacterium]
MPPASDPRQRAWARFVVANALLTERIETAFAAAGLPSLDWYDVLWMLERSEHGRLRMADLAEQAVVSRSNVTRLADRLEKAGLVARMNCPVDGRSTYCVLTDKGRALRARMWPVYRRQIESLFGGHLSVREAEEMTKVFERIISSAKERSKS